MAKIGLISDTHNFLDPEIWKYFKDCDEVWHAGDFGSMEIIDQISSKKSLRAVYGNIDGQEIRKVFPEVNIFEIEGLKVCMKHIGGYPGRYAPNVKSILQKEKIKLFISGHSHILKVMPDKNLGLLHMNPGASGREGFHVIRTVLRFEIKYAQIHNLEVIELGPKHKIK